MAGLDDIILSNYKKVYYENPANTWVEITNVQSVTDPTDERNLIEVDAFGQDYKRKLVGSATTGNAEVVVNRKGNETSHNYLLASYKSKSKEKFKIVYVDPADASKGEEMEWSGQVASKTSSGEFDGVFTMTFSLSVDGALGDWTDIS